MSSTISAEDHNNIFFVSHFLFNVMYDFYKRLYYFNVPHCFVCLFLSFFFLTVLWSSSSAFRSIQNLWKDENLVFMLLFPCFLV
jgi:hypothetical protein